MNYGPNPWQNSPFEPMEQGQQPAQESSGLVRASVIIAVVATLVAALTVLAWWMFSRNDSTDAFQADAPMMTMAPSVVTSTETATATATATATSVETVTSQSRSIHTVSERAGANSPAAGGANPFAAAQSPRDSYLSPLACDGSYILIVESVLVNPSEDPEAAVRAALSRHPGALASRPGACGSLRGWYEGQEVFPIYYHYGSNLAGVCAAQGPDKNPRQLTNTVNYNSPC